MASEPKPPDAFLSYTRFDDRHDGGKISEFKKKLESAVCAITGEPFGIFQDVDGIGLGEHWPGKLDRMLDEVRFFIPILTPSYFKSRACREELEKFLRAEADRRRNDLVLPIHYIDCDVMEDEDLCAADPLASTLHERQRQDWRELRYSSFKTKRVRTALDELAKEIVRARRRPMPPRPAPQRSAAAPTSSETTVSPPASSPEPQHRKRPIVFRDTDAPWCPELVLIPLGEFMMGSTEPERRWAIGQGAQREWVDWEKPQHRVVISELVAVGKHPVTRGQFATFLEATTHDMSGGCWVCTGDKWEHSLEADWCAPGFEQTDDHPVVGVSWQDATAYVDWLGRETGQPYRLLSEAEWEYACRARTTTRYSWGDDPPTPEQANFGMKVRATAAAGTYQPNSFGLYDMHGNVLEWCQDCWNQGYAGGPRDGSAWTTGTCGRRVLRGGSWYDIPALLRSANRSGFDSGTRNANVGFRVARTLSRSEDRMRALNLLGSGAETGRSPRDLGAASRFSKTGNLNPSSHRMKRAW